MEHTKEIAVPATTRVIVDFVTCDICGAKIWEPGYEVNEVEVRHKTGANYPEGGSGEETSVDICGECFDKKLLPWLRSQGAEPRTEDWEWG
jgi:hypothetical protein